MPRIPRCFAIFFLLLVSGLSLLRAQDPVAALPATQVWMDHLTQGLMPFWSHPDALGNPMGAFPSTRCDDGTALDFKKPCPIIQGNYYLLSPQRYLVALSRQTYGYGVAFHMTGDPKYLAWMKAGVDYIRKNAIDRSNGGMYTQQDLTSGVWGPKMEYRNPQELGYGLLGLAFYYYLTRDNDVLADILPVRDHILGRYNNPKIGALGWVLEKNGSDTPDTKRLVATLDQMNTYHVILIPILPEPFQTEWKLSVWVLARMLINEFYSEKENLFFLSADTPQDLDIQTAGADFGHTAKALWMIRWAGLLTGDRELVDFSEKRAPKLFAKAYLPDTASWAQEVLAGGAVNPDKNWWIYAELDQFAGTLALRDPSYAQYLPGTYDYWLRYFVDTAYGEVWNGVRAKDNSPIRDYPKAWPWKNAYHSLEHSMIAWMTTAQLKGEPVTVYFAMPSIPDGTVLRPYFFDGEVTAVEPRDGGITAVTFRNLR